MGDGVGKEKAVKGCRARLLAWLLPSCGVRTAPQLGQRSWGCSLQGRHRAARLCLAPGPHHTEGLTVMSPGCRYWDEFHICALTVLWECQKEAAAVWEMLRRESQKVKFRGSLFDLCSPSTAQSSAWTQVPKLSVLGIPLIVTWLNSGPAAL